MQKHLQNILRYSLLLKELLSSNLVLTGFIVFVLVVFNKSDFKLLSYLFLFYFYYRWNSSFFGGPCFSSLPNNNLKRIFVFILFPFVFGLFILFGSLVFKTQNYESFWSNLNHVFLFNFVCLLSCFVSQSFLGYSFLFVFLMFITNIYSFSLLQLGIIYFFILIYCMRKITNKNIFINGFFKKTLLVFLIVFLFLEIKNTYLTELFLYIPVERVQNLAVNKIIKDKLYENELIVLSPSNGKTLNLPLVLKVQNFILKRPTCDFYCHQLATSLQVHPYFISREDFSSWLVSGNSTEQNYALTILLGKKVDEFLPQILLLTNSSDITVREHAHKVLNAWSFIPENETSYGDII